MFLPGLAGYDILNEKALRRCMEETMFDLVVIGSGAGLMAVEAASQKGLQAALIEKGKVGGTCLTRGCIPSKMLVYPADLLREAERGYKAGITFSGVHADWPSISKRVWERIGFSKKIEDSLPSYPGLRFLKGEAAFTGRNRVKVQMENGETAEIEGKKFLIATGARTSIPPIEGLEGVDYLTSETFFGEKYPETPYESLIIVGGGTIAAEFAHVFAAMGTRVTVLGRNVQLLPQEDQEISERVLRQMRAFGIDVRLNHEAVRAEEKDGTITVTARDRGTGELVAVSAKALLLASGVRPETDRLGLEHAGVETDEKGWIRAGACLQTSNPDVFALGDVIGPPLFRHKANYQAGLFIENEIWGQTPKRARDERATPWAVFCMPQVGHVGLTEKQVRALQKPYYAARYHLHETAAGMAMGYREGDGDDGFVKILMDTDRHILGAHIAGFQAAALVQPFCYLMNAGEGKEKGSIDPMLRSMVIHPTLSEFTAWSMESVDWAHPIDPLTDGAAGKNP